MENLLGVAGFLLVGAATPGPNNLVVWHAASRRGFSGALPAIAGVVVGGLLLLALAMSGLDALFAAVPPLRIVLVVAGCAYLTWLGVVLIVRPDPDGSINTSNLSINRGPRKLPEGFAGLLLFQFLNPKGWVLMATVASAAPAFPGLAGYASVAALFLVISLVCLGAWAALGRLFAVARRAGRDMGWFERSMGCLLVASAALLLFGK